MITISLCMIVKNEEKMLARCLDSVANLMDEIIIVDTGSTDRTKEIAARYTDKIYDFEWCDDFSAARNFSFSKATMDYIYVPDADEYLDPVNRQQFAILKSVLTPDIEIVQMYYDTKQEFNTVQNSSHELRPKLFKRLREFTWVDPVHETVRLTPVVYDSDIRIQHLPQASHGKRDFSIFEKAFVRDGYLSERIITMYAKELLKCGDLNDLSNALPVLAKEQDGEPILDTWEAILVYTRYYRIAGDKENFWKLIDELTPDMLSSEICYEVGEMHFAKGSYEAAAKWYYDAVYTYAPVIDIESNGKKTLQALADCYNWLGDSELATKYQHEADVWRLPELD